MNWHSGAMDLLTLNLHRPLRWDAWQADEAGIHTAEQALAAALAAPEDAEIVLVWDWHDIVDDASPDGPKVRRPVAAPKLTAAAGLHSPFPEQVASRGDAMELAAGRYLFVQTRPSGNPAIDAAGLPDLFEWFAREAWWSRSPCDGPFVLRLVREDNDTALQLIRHLSGPATPALPVFS